VAHGRFVPTVQGSAHTHRAARGHSAGAEPGRAGNGGAVERRDGRRAIPPGRPLLGHARAAPPTGLGGRRRGRPARSAGDDRARARALSARANQLGDRGERAAAGAKHREALTIHQRIGDEAQACFSILALSDELSCDLRLDEARPLGEQGLALARRLRSPRLVERSLINLALEGGQAPRSNR
jgi:hypothetical protein